jgi:hypothetical protein
MKQYQKKINVVRHIVTKEWKPLWKILKYLPKDLKILSIACAEGFDVWMATKRGYKADGIEIHKDKVITAKKNLNLNLIHGDIFERFGLFKKYNCFIICRFLHNIGHEASIKLMNEINCKRSYLLIIKYKPGKYKETGKKRQPLATKKGLSNFLDIYDLKGKSFPQEFLVLGKGKYKDIPKMLREYIPQEGV